MTRAIGTGLLLGAIAAVFAIEVLGRPLFSSSAGGWFIGTLTAACVGAVQGALTATGPSRGLAGRRALLGAAVAFASAALLIDAPFPWSNLSVFGAGPFGALAVIALPAAGAAAGWVTSQFAVRQTDKSR